MKKSEIKVGGLYSAKVDNKLTTVKVDSISKSGYRVTNLATGRETVFKTAQKFRSEVEKSPIDNAGDELAASDDYAKPKSVLSQVVSENGAALTTAPHVIVKALAGTGKEQPVFCMVQTPNGPRRIGNLAVGDDIFGANGKVQVVDGVFPQGIKDVYRVEFRDGAVTYCGLEHIWTVNNKGKYGDSLRNITTAEMLETGLRYAGGVFRYRIPLCQPVEYLEQSHRIPAYLLGLLIGDGALTGNSIALSFDQQDTVWEETVPMLRELGLVTKFRNTSANGIQTTLIPNDKAFANGPNWLKYEIVRLGLNVKSGERFIPDEYLFGSVQQRLDLLRGLMDSDGTCRRNRTAFHTTSAQLKEDVKTLVNSLGGTAIEGKTDTQKQLSDCYPINVKMFVCPFRYSEKKSSVWSFSAKNPPSRYIKSIKKIAKPCRQVCIKVSSPDELYLTDNFIVTHNTTTLVEGLKRIKGIDSPITPSPQQSAVWEAMASGPKPTSIAFVAFNKSIATELQERVPAGCSAMTMHSMGYAAVRERFGRVKVQSWRVANIISELTETDIRDLRKNDMALLQGTEKLVGLCKMNLSDCSEESLEQIASHYDVELNGSRDRIFDLVPRVIERCKDVSADNEVDFNDMVWLPVALNLPVQKFDLLLVDESQDLNKCQQQLAMKAGRRLILVGDVNQAIYGFAGADAESMGRMESMLEETAAGVVVLPLNETRRCGKAIVAEAQKIVPDFCAHESNGEGLISRAKFKGETDTYQSLADNGDMVLCRVNAPLVSECFRFIKAGRKANIQGRDIGQGLISTVKKMKADDIGDLAAKLSDWLNQETEKENRKRNPSEARLIAIGDRHDCLMYFIEDAKTVDDVIAKINDIFTDERHGDGIKLSSVHKSKGLESDRVFILMPKGAGMPHPMAKSNWQRKQEDNLLYVAITRSVSELVYVTE